MNKERAVCPYCGKYSMKMYNPDVERQREQVHCDHCRKVYSVVYGGGNVKSERSR